MLLPLALSLQLLAIVPGAPLATSSAVTASAPLLASAPLRLLPPRLLRTASGAETAGTPSRHPDDTGRFDSGFGLGLVGVLGADLLSLVGATALGLAITAVDEPGDFRGLTGLVVGVLSVPLTNFFLAPFLAVLGARHADRGHPGAADRSIWPSLLAALGAKSAETLALGGALLLANSGNPGPAVVALLLAAGLHYAGIPFAASMGLHLFQPATPPANEFVPHPPPPPRLPARPEVPAPPAFPETGGFKISMPVLALSF